MSEEGDMGAWVKRRTCSRVSSGVCEDCRRQTYHSAWRNGKLVLCNSCYEERYEPDKIAARKVRVAAVEKKKKDDLALALEGKLPGATVTESGTVLGPPALLLEGRAYGCLSSSHVHLKKEDANERALLLIAKKRKSLSRTEEKLNKLEAEILGSRAKS